MGLIRLQRGLLVFILQLTWLSASAAAEENDGLPNELELLDCVIVPSITADLGSHITGILQSVEVDRGDFVNAGDVIAVLESSVDTASLELARARVSLTAEIELRRANAEFGKRQSKRIADLYERSMISSKEMDQTHTETKLTQLQLNQALDDQKLAELEYLRAKEVVERHTIRSPITGFVMDRFKTLGEYVDDQPIIRIAQLSPLNVEVIIPVEQLGKVQKGMMANVRADAVDNSWQAMVSRIDRVADVASGTFGVRLTLDNPNYDIPAGLRCKVSFISEDNSAQTETVNVSQSTTLSPGPESVAEDAVIEQDLTFVNHD
jgi:RND family efflux transporter MFP subunit